MVHLRAPSDLKTTLLQAFIGNNDLYVKASNCGWIICLLLFQALYINKVFPPID